MEHFPENPTPEDLAEFVIRAILAKQAGEETDEDAVIQAIEWIVGATMVRSGADIDDVYKQFAEHEHRCLAKLDPITQDLDIMIEWKDSSAGIGLDTIMGSLQTDNISSPSAPEPKMSWPSRNLS